MNKYICTNKRCKEEFYYNSDAPIINCPHCNTEILNHEKVINKDNFLYIETMFKNISTYGIKETFKMIDKHYHNAITRTKIRQIFFDTLKVLNKNFNDAIDK